MPCDLVIAAIGQQVEQNVVKPGEGIELDRWNCVVVNPDTLETTRKTFCGGDCVLGPLTLVHALDQGERAAASIRDYLLHGEVYVRPGRRIRICSRGTDVCQRVYPDDADAQGAGDDARTGSADGSKFCRVDQVISGKQRTGKPVAACVATWLYSVVTESDLPREYPAASPNEPSWWSGP